MARKQPPPRGPQLKLAGDLSVAFVNTASAAEDNRQAGVKSYAELLAWGRQVDTLSTLEAERLGRRAAERPADAEETFAGIAKVRSALFRILLAVGRGRQLPHEDLAIVNGALSGALAAGRLVQGEAGVVWGWAGDEDALDRVIWPVLGAARDLLLSLKGRAHVRQCANRACRLFFVDRSPSGQRRWCAMKSCGHRVNSLRHYHRLGKHSRHWPPLEGDRPSSRSSVGSLDGLEVQAGPASSVLERIERQDDQAGGRLEGLEPRGDQTGRHAS